MELHQYYIRHEEDDDPVYIGDFGDEWKASDYLDVMYPVTYPLYLYCNGTDDFDNRVARRSCIRGFCHWEYIEDYMYSDWHV